MANCTPDRGRNRTQREFRRPKYFRETVIQDMGLKEKYFNWIIIVAGAISVGIGKCIMENIQIAEDIYLSLIYAMRHRQSSDQTGPPPTFDVLPTRSIARLHVYFFTALVFSNWALLIAFLGKQKIRDRRDSLLRQQEGAEIPKISVELAQELLLYEARFRLRMLAAFLFILAVVDAVVMSVSLIIPPLVIFCGLRYVLCVFE